MIHPLNAASNTHFLVSVSKSSKGNAGRTLPVTRLKSLYRKRAIPLCSCPQLADSRFRYSAKTYQELGAATTKSTPLLSAHTAKYCHLFAAQRSIHARIQDRIYTIFRAEYGPPFCCGQLPQLGSLCDVRKAERTQNLALHSLKCLAQTACCGRFLSQPVRGTAP